jgi:uncharacterized protein YcfJ
MLQTRLSFLAGAAALAFAGSAAAQVTFYEHPDFRGRAYTITNDTADMGRIGFGDRASSAIVERGRWLVCHDAGYRGDCTILRPGQYVSLRDAGFEDSISSARRVNGNRGANYREADVPPAPQQVYEYRQRPNERVFEAPVSSAVAVRGSPEQRCWTERDRTPDTQREMSAPGAIIGGIVGGILGHQVGKGSGNTAATIGGAVGGAALGANAGRIKDRVTGRDVERCENVGSNRVEYYDVTYNFRGVTHRVQTQTDPGRTITVNQRGEPRG